MRGELFASIDGGSWEATDASQNPPCGRMNQSRFDQLQSSDGPSVSSTEYKEVVVIGNGPSAICLSYILAGNWPYYGNAVHPIEFLHQRLDANRSISLLLQDLQFLCEGLEGRSNNPVSVLFDTLIHPDADLGVEAPSALLWVHRQNQAINHVVLGSGPPGGAWQVMEQSALTLSLSHWMELPNMNYKEWEQERLRNRSLGSGGKQSRALVGNVARYLSDYVKCQHLEQHFRSNCMVTSVRRLHFAEEGSTRGEGDHHHHHPCIPECDRSAGSAGWEVLGYSLSDQTPFRYVTPNLVLATGSSDRPNRLNVRGEDLAFVTHSSSQLEQLIIEKRLGPYSDPIMIVGAGLTAADAIITARFYRLPIVHVFRRDVHDPSLIFNKLPENMYPEYHKVHQMMMRGNGGVGYRGYRSYAMHHLVEVVPGHKVRLEGPHASTVLKVSYVLVLIGSQPQLSFLGPDGGAHLAATSTAPIDGRRNLLQVDAYTHESVREEGLFAMGPLVGDNFVRFLQGGALAIASHLVQQRNRLADHRRRQRQAADNCSDEEQLLERLRLRRKSGETARQEQQQHQESCSGTEPEVNNMTTVSDQKWQSNRPLAGPFSWRLWKDEQEEEEEEEQVTVKVIEGAMKGTEDVTDAEKQGEAAEEEELSKHRKRPADRMGQPRRRKASHSSCDTL